MTIRLGILMDPIDGIKVAKDTTLAMMLAAQKRGWSLHYFEREGLFMRDGEPAAAISEIEVFDNEKRWFDRKPAADKPLADVDCILMRLDPPFNMNYVFATYFLQRAADRGVLVLNDPGALRDINEKMYTAWFPDCCPPTLITSRSDLLRDFHAEHGDIIVKPLDGMGGASIFRLRENDPNVSVVLETMTDFGSIQIMAQRYIPEISDGDKRILVVNGKPVSHALARMPAAGETRGNLAAGGTGIAVPLTDRDREIVDTIGPELKKRDVLFAGIDVIGNWVTEINVTSPTCVRELDAQCGLDIGSVFMDAIDERLSQP